MNKPLTLGSLGFVVWATASACGGRARSEGQPGGSGGVNSSGSIDDRDREVDEMLGQPGGDGDFLDTSSSNDTDEWWTDHDFEASDPCACQHSASNLNIVARYPASQGWGGAYGYGAIPETAIGMTYPDPPPPGLMARRSCDALQSPAFFEGKCEPTEIAGCVGDIQDFCVHVSFEHWSKDITVTWFNPDGSVSHVKSGQADMPITMTALPDSPYTHVQGEFVFTAEEGVIVSGSFDACHVGGGTCVR